MTEKRFLTSIATSDERSITVRDRDLTTELVGEMDFGEFFYFHLTGEDPTESEARLFNAVLVTIAEHGVTPSVIAARLTYDSAPEALQAAVSSGLLGAGDTLLGSMENVAAILQTGAERVEAGEDIDDVAREAVESYDRLPGFGHPLHEPTDPRSDRLLELLEEEGLAGDHVAFLEALHEAAKEQYGDDLVLNATGAIGAVVSELGMEPLAARGLALVSRAAGLLGHIYEEAEQPMARGIWDVVDEHVEYRGDPSC